MTGCKRCGRPVEPSRPHERYCEPCRIDVAVRETADAKRVIRFPRAKALDRWGQAA